MLLRVTLFLAREVKNIFYIYIISLRQAYEKTLQTTSCFISHYSQVERKKLNHTLFCTWEKGGNGKGCKLLKVPYGSFSYNTAEFALVIWGLKMKNSIMSQGKGRSEPERVAWCSAGLGHDCCCMQDILKVPTENVSALKSSNSTIILLFFELSTWSPWSLPLKDSSFSGEESSSSLFHLLPCSSL